MASTDITGKTAVLPVNHKQDGSAVLTLDHEEHNLAALLGASTIHRGDIYLTNEDGLLVRGVVIGCIYTKGAVVIDKSATVFGSIYAGYLHCSGTIAGMKDGKPAPDTQANVQVLSAAAFYEGAKLHAKILCGDEVPVISRGVKYTGKNEFDMMTEEDRVAFEALGKSLALDFGMGATPSAAQLESRHTPKAVDSGLTVVSSPAASVSPLAGGMKSNG